MENLAVKKWVKEAIGNEECTVEITGTMKKGSGYVADIFFIKVMLNQNIIDLVAKVSKNDPKMRQLTGDICQREVYIYDKILPIFKQFQTDKNIIDSFDAIPKCYKAFLCDNIEIIVQENLKPKGYRLHPRSKPMHVDQIKLVIKNYAKFHAISLALKDQKLEIFNIIDSLSNIIKDKIIQFDVYATTEDKVVRNLQAAGRNDLVERYKALVAKGIRNIMVDIVNDVPNERVLTHGDSHINNIMFQYQNEDTEIATNVVFIDFQLSSVLSPMLDLSYFIYCASSGKELQQLSSILDYYHEELTAFLNELGSDVDKLYPKTTMQHQWKKYSFFGFNVLCTFMEFLFMNDEDAPDVSEIAEDANNFFKVKINDMDGYLKRLVEMVDFYLDFEYK